MHRCLLIDDDRRLADMVAQYLRDNGFAEVCLCPDGQSGLASARARPFDVVLLDVMLPDLDGFEICRRIRAESPVPIVMLTARGEDTDRIVGLELGADDYLPKPFNPRELLARIRAVLRRSRPQAGGVLLRFGRLAIDRGARVARIGERTADLTAHQFNLLLALAERPGRVLSRAQIMQLVRGDDLEAFDRSIDVHISRIRAEIEDDPRHPRRILTLRGAGYLFAERQDDPA